MKTLIRYTVQEFCKRCDFQEERLNIFIEKEWIKPQHDHDTFFDDEDLARARLIKDLVNDFDLNDDAVSIVLNLLDQIHYLRASIKQKI